MKIQSLSLSIIIVIVVVGILAGIFLRLPSRTSYSPQNKGDIAGSEEFGLTKEELVKKIEAVEEKIASCMTNAGFQYVPVDYVTVRKSMDADKRVSGLSDDEFRAQFGYGISTRLSTAILPPQLKGADNAATVGLGSENINLFKNLSPSDQAAYNRSLLGDNSDATFAVSLEAEDFSKTGGCTRSAIEQVFTSNELIASYINPGDALIAQDKRVIDATTQWSDCMREAGFDYTTLEAIEPNLKDRVSAITSGADISTLSPEASRVLNELQGLERAVAVADFECAEEFIEPALRQVETELYGAPQN